MYLDVTKKVKQLFIDFFNNANDLVSIPEEHILH